MQDSASQTRFGYVVVLIFLLAAGGIGAGAWWLGRQQEHAILDARYKELTAIGQLKVRQIAAWRAERLVDVQGLADSPLVGRLVEQWLADPRDPEGLGLLQGHLQVSGE